MSEHKVLKEGRRWFGLRKRKNRLGRHVHFDERSRQHRVLLAPHQQTLITKTWDRQLPPLDQGQIGSCTANGCVGCLATQPIVSDGVADGIAFDEQLALAIYTRATELDPIPGQYPQEDTGSTVLAAMQAAKEMGLISGYRWCMGTDDALKTLSYLGPVEIGISWYSGFDQPDANGRVQLGGKPEGGHAFELISIDVERELVWAVNSWGSNWGLNGRFCFSFRDLRRLLREDGEAVMVLKPGEA